MSNKTGIIKYLHAFSIKDHEIIEVKVMFNQKLFYVSEMFDDSMYYAI